MGLINLYFHRLLKDKNFFLAFTASLFINCLMWLLIVWKLPISSSWIPLYYNVYLGIGWIGPWLMSVFYPGIALAIILVNFTFALYFFDKKPELANWLIWSCLLVQIITSAVLIALIINFFS